MFNTTEKKIKIVLKWNLLFYTTCLLRFPRMTWFYIPKLSGRDIFSPNESPREVRDCIGVGSPLVLHMGSAPVSSMSFTM